MKSMRTRVAVAVSLSLAIVALAASPARADKLVLFKNGKAMRVKSIVKEGKWLRCEFEDKNFLSVPAAGVLSIEEAVLSARDSAVQANQVAVGSGAPYVPAPRGGPVGQEAGLPADLAPPQVDPDEQEDMQAAMAEEEEARRRNPVNFGGAQSARGRFGQPAQNAVAPGMPGLQPFNQPGTPFQNRRLQQRGTNRSPLRQGLPQGSPNQNQEN